MIEKISYGIICVDVIGKRVCLVQKYNTYAFVDFIQGRYIIDKPILSNLLYKPTISVASKATTINTTISNTTISNTTISNASEPCGVDCVVVSDKKNTLTTLLDCMSENEKIDILCLTFPFLWYKVYNNYGETQGKRLIAYELCKKKFESINMGFLRREIYASRNEDPIWELPKGRKDSTEDNIDAAIREFCEETKLDTSKFTPAIRIQPYVEHYIDAGVKYINYYYYAVSDAKIPNKYIGNSETKKVQFVHRSDLKKLDLRQNRRLRLEKIYDLVFTKHYNKLMSVYKASLACSAV